MRETIYFAKLHNDAIIPTKREEDAGYDLYARFDDDYLYISPGEIKLIPTDLCCAFNEDFVMVIKERGSSGSKGMAVRMGIVDSGFRGNITVGINNTSDRPILLYKKDCLEKFLTKNPLYRMYPSPQITYYPAEKAIAQALILPLPKTKSEELPHEELLKKFPSERGEGMLGSSKK